MREGTKGFLEIQRSNINVSVVSHDVIKLSHDHHIIILSIHYFNSPPQIQSTISTGIMLGDVLSILV